MESSPPPYLGFLTVRHEAGGYVGGYLVTNQWGRPLEFRLSSPVQPNRVQQILYAETLPEFVCGEVIGKTLVEKTATPIRIVLTDTIHVLSLRRCVEAPVIWVAPLGDPRAEEMAASGFGVRPADRGRGPLIVHPEFPEDSARCRDLIERLNALDLLEPFVRIREAVAEARKMGVTHRAAG
jgi:hypothetical protein